MFLTGGPGGSGLGEGPGVAKEWHPDRDVIFLDQRGALKSDPFLSCPEIDTFMASTVGLSWSAPETAEQEGAVVQACRDRLDAAGADLAAYNTTESTADVADLRIAMGYDEWNLYGISYGSDLALQTLRDHPAGIRSVVVDAVLPPNINPIEIGWRAANESATAIYAACAADPACHGAFPEGRAEYIRVLNDLAAHPRTVHVADPKTGTDTTVVIDAYKLSYTVQFGTLIGSPPKLPSMIHNLAVGDGTEAALEVLAGVSRGASADCDRRRDRRPGGDRCLRDLIVVVSHDVDAGPHRSTRRRWDRCWPSSSSRCRCRRRWSWCGRRSSATPRSGSGRGCWGATTCQRTSDHYRIGSITKTMTATVILQLAQEGKLSLDDPISKYRPDVPNGDNITIAQLLDMRSGLAGYTENPVFQRAVDKDPERIWRPDELLALAFSAPASFPPGTAWQYSNTNYILLGLVMEDVTGQTVPDLFQERVFDPLGMNGTVMPALDDASMPAVYAHGYQFGTAEKTFGPDPALPADEQQAAADGELLPADWSGANPSIAWTAGSVISTADDLVVWTKALVDGELLDPETQAQRLASIQPIDPTQPDGPAYGSGMIRAGSYFGHAGQISGYESQVIRNPETDTTIVALAALSVSPDGRGPASELSRAVRLQLTET